MLPDAALRAAAHHNLLNGEDSDMARYRFITAVSLAALEQDLNRAAADDPSLDLVQVLHVPATGFVAVVEVDEDDEDDSDAARTDGRGAAQATRK